MVDFFELEAKKIQDGSETDLRKSCKPAYSTTRKAGVSRDIVGKWLVKYKWLCVEYCKWCTKTKWKNTLPKDIIMII